MNSISIELSNKYELLLDNGNYNSGENAKYTVSAGPVKSILKKRKGNKKGKIKK